LGKLKNFLKIQVLSLDVEFLRLFKKENGAAPPPARPRCAIATEPKGSEIFEIGRTHPPPY
jgi:hypothetical protein